MSKKKKKTNWKKKRKKIRARRKNARRKKNKELKKQRQRHSYIDDTVDDTDEDISPLERFLFGQFLESIFSEDDSDIYGDEFSDLDLGYDDLYDDEPLLFGDDLYLSDMRKYADATMGPVPPVEYENIFGRVSYSNMNRDQLDYYLYWRDMARKGSYLPASYNYFLLYFVELFNLVGVKDAEEAFKRINHLYMAVHDTDQMPFTLTEVGESNLAQNIFDFAYYHDLDLLRLHPFVWSSLNSFERDLLALEYFSQFEDLVLPFELIVFASNFDLFNKTRIPDESKLAFREALINTFYVLDKKSREEKNVGLIESKYVFKKPISIYMTPFKSAVIDRETYDTSKKTTTRLDHESTMNFLSEVIQETENVFRDFYNIRGRLRKHETDEWTKKIIEDFLKAKYDPNKGYEFTDSIKPAKDYINNINESKKIELNTKKLEKLRSDTIIVQELLDSSNYEEGQSELREEKDALQYVEPLTFVLSNLIKADSTLITYIQDLIEKNAPTDSIADDTLEMMTQTALRYLDQPLVVKDTDSLKINGKYTESLEHIFENLEDYPFLIVQERESETVGSEIEDFTENLSDTDLKFLEILVNESSPRAQLESLAMSEMTMVELIIDEINNSALLYLEDILLDMDENNQIQIIEEYRDDLERKLKRR